MAVPRGVLRAGGLLLEDLAAPIAMHVCVPELGNVRGRCGLEANPLCDAAHQRATARDGDPAVDDVAGELRRGAQRECPWWPR